MATMRLHFDLNRIFPTKTRYSFRNLIPVFGFNDWFLLVSFHILAFYSLTESTDVCLHNVSHIAVGHTCTAFERSVWDECIFLLFVSNSCLVSSTKTQQRQPHKLHKITMQFGFRFNLCIWKFFFFFVICIRFGFMQSIRKTTRAKLEATWLLAVYDAPSTVSSSPWRTKRLQENKKFSARVFVALFFFLFFSVASLPRCLVAFSFIFCSNSTGVQCIGESLSTRISLACCRLLYFADDALAHTHQNNNRVHFIVWRDAMR